MRSILVMLCVFSFVLQSVDSLSQEIEIKEVSSENLTLSSFNEAMNNSLIANVEDISVNNALKNTEKKVISKKKASVKKKTVAKKKSKKTKYHMTNSQIRSEKAKNIYMLDGKASWYGDYFHGRKTASGALYDKYMYTSAHRTLPFGTIVEIVDAESDNRIVVCITDRGPFIKGRAIDVSHEVAEQLDLVSKGVAPVTLKIVGDKKGEVLLEDEAFYVTLKGNMNEENLIGPFTQFADASVMWEAMHQVHPKSSIVIDIVKTN